MCLTKSYKSKKSDNIIYLAIYLTISLYKYLSIHSIFFLVSISKNKKYVSN